VGIAGVCAFSNRKLPEEVTLEDLDAVSDFMVREYYSGRLGPYLSCVFMNASFVQPNEGDDKRAAFESQYLRAHRADPHEAVAGHRCVFSGAPATSPLVRTHLPLFSGEGVLNFRPGAETSVPAAGSFVVALLFLPMAGRRAEGRLLVVQADDPDLTLRFARRYLEDNRRLLALPLPAVKADVFPEFEREVPSWDAAKKRHKFADVKGPRSLLVADLSTIAGEAGPSDLRPRPTTLTAYWLSNSGQGPSLEMFHVPAGVVRFVTQAAGATTRTAWQAVSARFLPPRDRSGEGEEVGPSGGRRARKQQASALPGRPGWSKNPAFEDLCHIFDAGFTDYRKGAEWLRRYLLGRLDRATGAPRYTQTGARSWALTDLFLTEVLAMKPERIERIRNFSDKLASRIHGKNDRRLLNALTYDKLYEIRRALLRAQRESASGDLLFGLHEYAAVWLSEDGDEYLVRDLVCLRVIERLHELGYFAAHPEDNVDTGENDRDANHTEKKS
jgi:CRISPR-associated protein Cst1